MTRNRANADGAPTGLVPTFYAQRASLGLLINQNRNELNLHPWLFFIPFAFIVMVSLAVNFMGDGLRDALDPRQRRVRA